MTAVSGLGPWPGGADALLATMHWYDEAFEDQRVEILHAVAEGDLVALHVELSARHTGFFRGVAPTGRRFRVREMHVLRFAEGQEAEHWCVRDESALVRALAHPAPVGVGRAAGRAVASAAGRAAAR